MEFRTAMQTSDGGAPKVRHPVDHGWAWLVCLGAFGINFFVNGGLRSTGIIFIELVIRYQADQSLTSLTVAAMASGFAIFSAIGSAVGAVKTMRLACLIGAVLMFLGMFFTYFATNIYIAIVTLGLMSGIGYGFAFTQSMVVVGQYFLQRRSLAVGFAAAGGSIGTLILPLYIGAATQEFGFEGMILIYSGIVLHAIPSAMLLRPVSFYQRSRKIATKSPAFQEDARNGKSVDPEDEITGSRLIVPLGGSVETLPREDDETVPAAETNGCPETREPPQPAAPGNTPPPPPTRLTCGMVVRMFFRRICDRELFHHIPFLLYAIGLTFGHGGFISNCLFIPPFAFELWQSKELAALLIVILGVADLVGRVGGGWFSDLGLVRKPFIIGFSFIGAGAVTVIFPFFPQFVPMVIYVIVLGMLGGTYLAQMFVVAADLVGPAKSPSALGLATLGMGLALIPLLPILSAIASASGTFATSLRTSGVLLLISGIFFYLIPTMQKVQSKRDAENKQKKQPPGLQKTSA